MRISRALPRSYSKSEFVGHYPFLVLSDNKNGMQWSPTVFHYFRNYLRILQNQVTFANLLIPRGENPNYDKMSKHSTIPTPSYESPLAALSYCNPCQWNRLLPGQPQSCHHGSCNCGEEIRSARVDRCCRGLWDQFRSLSPASSAVTHVEQH